jgi:recombination protein RecA
MGVDCENLTVIQQSCGEDALEIVDTLVRSSAVDIIVVDSVAALTPRAELEGEIGDKLSEHLAGLSDRIARRDLPTKRISATRPTIPSYQCYV